MIMIDVGFFIESFEICDFDFFFVIQFEFGCQCYEIELIVFENIVS